MITKSTSTKVRPHSSQSEGSQQMKQDFVKIQEENSQLKALVAKKDEELTLQKNFESLMKLLKLEYKRSNELIHKLEEEKKEIKEEMTRQGQNYFRKKVVYGFCILLMLGYIVKIL